MTKDKMNNDCYGVHCSIAMRDTMTMQLLQRKGFNWGWLTVEGVWSITSLVVCRQKWCYRSSESSVSRSAGRRKKKSHWPGLDF